MHLQISGRDMAVLGSLLCLGILAFQFGALVASSDVLVLPVLILALASLIIVGATITLITGRTHTAYRVLFMGALLLLAVAFISGLTAGVPIAIASAFIWVAIIKLNNQMRKGLYGQ